MCGFQFSSIFHQFSSHYCIRGPIHIHIELEIRIIVSLCKIHIQIEKNDEKHGKRSEERGREYRVEKIKSNLTSSSATLTERWVALQFCRKRAPSREELGNILIEALKFNKESVLMRHEIAFALGQTGRGVETLKKIMRDAEHEDEVTRHEAAESLSTLVNCKNEFETYAKNRDRFPILADTCALALEGMRRFLSGEIDAAFAPCGCQTHKNKEKTLSPQKKMTIKEEIAACAVLGSAKLLCTML